MGVTENLLKKFWNNIFMHFFYLINLLNMVFNDVIAGLVFLNQYKVFKLNKAILLSLMTESCESTL